MDTLLQGKLAIIQRKRGYRFSLDALLLPHFLETRGKERVVDLGTGSGIIPLILVALNPLRQVVGLEVQQGMVDRALRSVGLNDLHDRVEIVRGDVRSIERHFPPRSFDVAVSNPPYRRLRSGRTSPDPERTIARHEVMGSLRDFLRAGSYLLRPGGRMDLVYPATRTVDLLGAMRQEGLEPNRLRVVYSFEGAPAALVLAEGIKGARNELKIMPPLVVYAEGKQYTKEMNAILEGRPCR
ncbi:MAG: tRNA1(Val) (adenine(37)-N6)-methyltransferase [Candidatus Binatia bacterium]